MVAETARTEFSLGTVEEEDETISVVADDIEQQSRDFVLKQIHQKLKGHGLAEFVGHLLNLMGYKTKVKSARSRPWNRHLGE